MQESRSIGERPQVWNQAGVYPRRCEVLEQIAQQEDPEATVWTGSGVPHERKSRDHHVLLSSIPRVEDVQSA